MDQVADRVYRLGSASHNFYLVVDGDEVTVVDAGCVRDWRRLEAGLAAIDRSIDSVSGVLVTHGHSDHLGFGARARQAGISVHIHDDDEVRAVGGYGGRFSAGASDLPLWSLTTWRIFIPMVLAGVMRLDHLEDVSTFTDGETLDVPGRPTTIHTPGHTEGHTMFLFPEWGMLFTGDGLVTLDLIDGSRGPRHMNDVFDLEPDMARRSLDRIVDIDADLILPGHGRPWAGTPRRAVELARAR